MLNSTSVPSSHIGLEARSLWRALLREAANLLPAFRHLRPRWLERREIRHNLACMQSFKIVSVDAPLFSVTVGKSVLLLAA